MPSQPETDSYRYSEEEMLQLSGVQHFVFCPRQWALIHIEQLWADNSLTVEGSLLHENVDNPFNREVNGPSVITLRGLRLCSSRLGLSGIADAVEIHPYPDAPAGKQAILKSGLFDALPVEYKRGKSKINDCDRLQVVAQSVILEEMLKIKITRGAVFYWETRHREYIDISEDLRGNLHTVVAMMHDIARSNILPSPIKKPHCRSCSLLDVCIPSLSGRSALKYLKNSLDVIDE